MGDLTNNSSNIDNINSSDLGTGASDTETSSQAKRLGLLHCCHG
jgi:hypothetical protein